MNSKMDNLSCGYMGKILTVDLTKKTFRRDPIDAEAIYHNPRLGLVDILQLKDERPQNPILDMLRWH